MPLPSFLAPYLSFIPTIALLAGLVFDIFTIDRPDALFENIVISAYFVISAGVILLLQRAGTERRRILLLAVLQFAFGNLASALMVLYTRSGTFTGSAVFIGFLALLFVGNEVFKTRYSRTLIRLFIFFVLLLTYANIFIPVLLGSIGILALIISTSTALGVMGVLVLLLRQSAPGTFVPHIRKIITLLGATALIFVVLYVQNLIPPVPLALKHIGMYHHASRTNDTYLLRSEPAPWYLFWRSTHPTYHHIDGNPAFCFASVFAPARLVTEIRHIWERYDDVSESWITVARIPFAIRGGREDGFRGYTQTQQITPGVWRCGVETARGTLIGRTQFTVIEGVANTVETTQ